MKKLCGNSLRLVLLTALLAVAAGLQAQVRGNSIVVTVEPDSKDWNYKVGQTAVFTVEVRRSGTLVDNVSVSYEEKYCYD